MTKLRFILDNAVLAVGLSLVISAVAYAQVFNAPTAIPPEGNTPAPLNVGHSSQVKNGALGVESLAVYNNANVLGVYQNNSVPGISKNCPAGQALTNMTTAGGIVTAGECAAIGGGSGGAVSGMIAIFDAACPSGWARFAALDGRFPLGGATFGAQGGASDVNSISTNVSPGSNTYSASNGGTVFTYAYGNHQHLVPPPPYLTVVWCKKN